MKNFTYIIVLCLITISTSLTAQSNQPHVYGGKNIPDFKSMESFNTRNTNSNTAGERTEGTLIALYDSIYFWSWNTSTEGWNTVPDEKAIDFTYNANNSMTGNVYQFWSDTAWFNNYKGTDSYDTHNNRISSLEQIWNDTVWVDYDLVTFTYDANNNQTSELEQIWNEIDWGNIFKDTFTYDANNNQTSEVYQIWNETAWVNNIQWIYTYDVNNNQTSNLNQQWNDTTWVNDALYTYAYDVNNNRISNLQQDWSGTAWGNAWLYGYAYNANNYLASDSLQSWNDSAWVNVSGDLFTYDANNNKTSWYERLWTLSFGWENEIQDTYTYDANNLLLSDAFRDVSDTTLESGDSTYYYYHTVTSVINEPTTLPASVSIYPNPATDELYISDNLKSESGTYILTIFNMLGETIYTETVNRKPSTVNCKPFPAGTYFLQLTSTSSSMVRRFVKE